MSRMQMAQVQPVHTTTKDNMQRHENGITKNRKATPLTGGGRAWREDEETYLLQSRLQKMPYKHIAAHLNKTELACRLHYHQLSHGSTRRKRSGSCSSGSSDPSPRGRADVSPSPGYSPVFRGDTRSLSPSVVRRPYHLPRSVSSDVQLPGIASLEASPRLPALLPKSEALAYAPRQYPGEDLSRFSINTPDLPHKQPLTSVPPHHHHHHHPHPHHRLGSPAPFQQPPASSSPLLRLDTLSHRASPTSASMHTPAHVELPRLGAIYEAHKGAFWTAVANEYGTGASPAALEQAWRSGACCQYGTASSSCSQAISRPVTPLASPDQDRRPLAYRLSSQQDYKTRISSLLDDDTAS
ncbi:hypothetical protein E4U41_004354 [Claviceps citrina]|nr:hypothetical protein E4U41_004354 [Claviceps citrina]